jgi:pimeloyl-ACP methyl ester carboxylesterase
VSQPTLVVSGEDDPSVPLRKAVYSARLPEGRLRGGGHLFLLDEPEQVAPAIRAFLDED